MDAVTKLMKRPHVCKSCGAELRMNLVFTSILSIIYLVLVVRTMIFTGINGESMLFVLLTTGVFVVACLFIPLENKQKQGASYPLKSGIKNQQYPAALLVTH
jgi:hypothetical protein